MLTHLPEAPTFTSGFARAWARVAVSGKVLIYKADSGLVWWARWPEALRSYWPQEMQACGPWSGGWIAKGKLGKWGRDLTDSKVSFFPFSLTLLFFSFFLSLSLLHTLSCLLCLSRSLDENSTNQLRINRDSDNTTTNSPFTATGVAWGLTEHCCTSAH